MKKIDIKNEMNKMDEKIKKLEDKTIKSKIEIEMLNDLKNIK